MYIGLFHCTFLLYIYKNTVIAYKNMTTKDKPYEATIVVLLLNLYISQLL